MKYSVEKTKTEDSAKIIMVKKIAMMQQRLNGQRSAVDSRLSQSLNVSSLETSVLTTVKC